ncbi:putative metal-dependent hydrolase, beta- lactamase superfamily I [Waddlia chondrophila WSU 86-1044]|nr:putative metal-dependent hydrolase, beta- lactamase superfamily I [Waddlia chondrophila WSU 86-1044]
MGVPIIGCRCPVCLSKDEKNKRTRPSAFLKAKGKAIVIDAGPDFRTQALREEISHIDGVIFTHAHHDHTAGLDDLRVFTIRRSNPIPCLLSEKTANDLKRRYDYIFREGGESKLVSKVELQILEEERGETHFLDISFRYLSYIQSGMLVNGFKVGNLAFITDIKNFSETIYDDLQGTKVLVVSALRHGPSHMHLTVEEALAFSRKVGAEQTWLTHIAHELDHEQTNRSLPSNVQLAYDGLTISFQE